MRARSPTAYLHTSRATSRCFNEVLRNLYTRKKMISLSRDLKQKRKLWKLNIPLQMFTENRTRKGNERSSSMCAWTCFLFLRTKKAVQRANEVARASLSCKLVELLRSKCSALRSISIAQLNTPIIYYFKTKKWSRFRETQNKKEIMKTEHSTTNVHKKPNKERKRTKFKYGCLVCFFVMVTKKAVQALGQLVSLS